MRFWSDTIIGLVVGFLSGLLGKGGSAIATPMLRIFVHYPMMVALASPLPVTLPTTLSAAFAYRKEHLLNWPVILWSSLSGLPAIIIGSFLTEWIGGKPLMYATALFIFVLGIGVLCATEKSGRPSPLPHALLCKRALFVGSVVGLVSGLLANSGGIMFAPLYVEYMQLDLKTAFSCSLLVAAAMSVPGTVSHWYLGHVNWWIVLAMSIGSIPSAYIGARLAIRARTKPLEIFYGIFLTGLSLFFIYFEIFHPF